MDYLNFNINFNIIRYDYMSQILRLPLFLYAAEHSRHTSSLDYIRAGFDVC